VDARFAEKGSAVGCEGDEEMKGGVEEKRYCVEA